jgi:hypothetical protein
MSMKALNYFNVRTFLAIVSSQLATFLAIQFNWELSHNILLFSLAIVFPLHFSLQAAFKRREKALEYFSLFKAGAMAVHYSFQVSENLDDDKKSEAKTVIKNMVNTLVEQLEGCTPGFAAMQVRLNEVMAFAERNRETISKRNVLRVIRYMKDVTDSTTYLISLVSHRTMHGIRFYATQFILLFPFIQAPIIMHTLGPRVPEWTLYFIAACGIVVIITLDNFQKLIEYPFDPKGPDNIKIREFDLDI